MTGENVKTLDKPLLEFFINLENKKLLENTNIVIFSDHGHHTNPF